MLRTHPHFTQPEEIDVIWKYFDLPSFLSLLENRKLFFSKIHSLEDGNEGKFSNNINPIFEWPETVFDSDFLLKDYSSRMLNNEERLRNDFIVNCWTMNKGESYALWKIYLKDSRYGFAIQTSVKNLIESVEEQGNDYYLTKIKYANDKYPICAKTPLEKITCKESFYQYENELRIVRIKDRKKPSENFDRYLSVDLNVLINKLYISPFTPSWFLNDIKSILKGKYDNYNLDGKLIISSISINDGEI